MKFKSGIKLLSVSLSLTLAACGGGGGGGAPTPLTESQIKAATTSANTAHWLMSSVDGIQFTGFSYIGALGITGPATGSNTTSVDIDPPGNPLCSSGSYSASWGANATGFVVGDYITLNLTNCVKADGYTYNGSETYTITAVSNSSSGTVEEITMKSDLSKLTVKTPQTILSSTPLTTVTFSGNDGDMTFKRVRAKNGSIYTYPRTYTSTGSTTAVVTTIATNIVSDTYSLSNAVAEDNYTDANNTHTYKINLTSNTNNFKNIVLTNITPYAATGSITTTHPTYGIQYSNASIKATTTSSDTVLNGTNSDNSAINDIHLYSSKYFQ